jgi:hypothetical protein
LDNLTKIFSGVTQKYLKMRRKSKSQIVRKAALGHPELEFRNRPGLMPLAFDWKPAPE